jgi:hypothetical protein
LGATVGAIVPTLSTYPDLTEAVIADAVRLRIFAAAWGAREVLWLSRGGLQLLDPDAAIQYGRALGELDRLLKLLAQGVATALPDGPGGRA